MRQRLLSSSAALLLALCVTGSGCAVDEGVDCAFDGGDLECPGAGPPSFNSSGGGVENEEPAPEASDNAASIDETHQLACAALRRRTCGFGETHNCDQLPACAAAELLSQYEPASCEEALTNEESYPPCEVGICYLLETKVCGAEQECQDLSTCQVVWTWRTQFEESQSASERDEVEQACEAALLDETVFPACE